MFKKGLLFGLGWFIAKNIVVNEIPEIIHLIKNGYFTNLRKKCEAGEIKTLSEVINYYDHYVPNKTESKIKNKIGF